jgi:hypothetical protein
LSDNKNNQYIYESVVGITHDYLGPAADRFIARQVHNHLHKEPEKITKEDLSQLVDWIRVAVSFLTDDTQIVEEYIEQLQQLSRGATKA